MGLNPKNIWHPAALAAVLGLWACPGQDETVAKPGEENFDSADYCTAKPSADGCCRKEATHRIDFEDVANLTLVPLGNRYKKYGVDIGSGSAGPYVVTAAFEGNQKGNAAVSGDNALLIGFNRTPVRFTFIDPIYGKKATVNRVAATVGDKSDETDLIVMTAYDFGGKILAADSFTAQPSRKAGDKDFAELAIDMPGIYYVVVNDTDASGANLDDFTYGCLHFELKP